MCEDKTGKIIFARKDTVEGAAFLLEMGNSTHAVSTQAMLPRAH